MAKALASALALWTYRPVRDLLRTLTRTHPLRIFTFHRVSDLCRDGMTVAPSVLERQIEHICRTHDVVTLAEALHMVRDGRRLRRPAALLTFDDGYRSVYDLARPVLARHGVVGCCFVTTDLVGTDRRFPHDDANPVRPMLEVMTWNQVRSLAEAGWAIGSHSASHARLSACHGEALRYEIEDSLRAIAVQVGPAETAIAYPFGGREDISPQALERIRSAGYAACFSDVFGETRLPCDPFALRRIEMGGDHGTLAWKLWAHGLTLTPFRR
jgi:peptidoglycan/xylan/chitin deacetylase (PgdA/CDA1 family)